jgi:hypothetical protein
MATSINNQLVNSTPIVSGLRRRTIHFDETLPSSNTNVNSSGTPTELTTFSLAPVAETSRMVHSIVELP